MKVITLEQFGEQNFLDKLKHFSELNYPGDDRNRDWFSRLPEIYNSRFEEWFFLVNANDLIAFSTIQKFYSGCYRLLTRTYYHPDYRCKHLFYDKTNKTPAMYILDEQLKFVKNYKTLFISMQDLKRRSALENVKNKIGSNWKMHPNMIQTCNEVNDKNCWQNVIFIGEDLQLPSVSISEWKKLQ